MAVPVGVSSVIYSREIGDGARLLDALLELGCDGLELEYRIGAATLAQMEPLLERRGAVVFSVHNFFPAPEEAGGAEGGGANALLFSALDPAERERAVRRAVVTLEHARRLGARAVVLHLGRVEFPHRLEPYVALAAAGRRDEPGARALLREHLAERRRSRGPHLDAVLRALERLNEEALARGLLLGVENRFHPREIPDHEETGRILAEFRGGAVRYWHDVGHALYQQHLGVIRQREWLQAYGAAAAGVHLHDIRGATDHLAPGTGEADFGEVLAALPAEALRVLEVRPGTPPEQLRAARDLVRGIA